VLFLADSYAKLRDNEAFGLLRQPRVLANYALSLLEMKARPTIMRSQPISAEIELTNRCNLACVQCLRSQGMKPYRLGNMPLDVYRHVLEQFPYLLTLSLNGFGEALMHGQLFEVVRYTKKLRPWLKVGIYSNGTRIDERTADQLVESQITEINVSIDAATPETYERVRRGGRYRKVLAGLSHVLRARARAGRRLPMVGVNFVLLNANRGELVPFIEQAAELGVDFVNCITYATYDWGFRNQRSADDYERELLAARKRLDELGLHCKSFPSQDLSWSKPEAPFSCTHFWGSQLRVTFEGDVTLGCCTPFKEQYSYGNLLEASFEQIWNNALFRRNRVLGRQGLVPNRICASCQDYAKSFFGSEHRGLQVIEESSGR
jgi:MoaA/NifB/PqqE/SkfB family radical SAM enzyme